MRLSGLIFRESDNKNYKQMEKYLLLLRGVNVGGHKKTPMAELKKMFSEMDFEKVQTLLNSGNVVFNAKKENEFALLERIGAQFEKTFGFKAPLILRNEESMQHIMKLDPFQTITVTKETRLYVSFLSEKASSELVLPYTSEKGDFRILQKTDREVFSVVNINSYRSVDAMRFLEKEYGKAITTRNWNTVKKIAMLME